MNGTPWSPQSLATLRQMYPDHPTAEIARALERSVRQVYARASTLGLRKSAAFLTSARSGRIQRGHTNPHMIATQFRPGKTPWNKGMKGVCGTHPNSRRTQFRKGQLRGAAQRNHVPVSSYRITKDGYLEQKVTDDHPVPARRWVGVHRLVWEAVNGPVPKGHVICFLPGRRTAEPGKITPDALELVSRAELARRNHPRSHSPELAQLTGLKSAITRQVNRIAREAKEKQP